jgi:hypothetical protein
LELNRPLLNNPLSAKRLKKCKDYTPCHRKAHRGKKEKEKKADRFYLVKMMQPCAPNTRSTKASRNGAYAKHHARGAATLFF